MGRIANQKEPTSPDRASSRYRSVTNVTAAVTQRLLLTQPPLPWAAGRYAATDSRGSRPAAGAAARSRAIAFAIFLAVYPNSRNIPLIGFE